LANTPSDETISRGPTDLEALRAGLRDFLTVYEAHFPSMTATLIATAATLPGLGQLFPFPRRHETEQRARASHELVRKAILKGEWEPLLEVRRAQGRLYAARGVALDELIEIFATFKELLVPHLVEAFASDAPRLVGALHATDRYVWFGFGLVAEAYAEAPAVRDQRHQGTVGRRVVFQ
jgi:hypothetical protein